MTSETREMAAAYILWSVWAIEATERCVRARAGRLLVEANGRPRVAVLPMRSLLMHELMIAFRTNVIILL